MELHISAIFSSGVLGSGIVKPLFSFYDSTYIVLFSVHCLLFFYTAGKAQNFSEGASLKTIFMHQI